jgi:hypothetical protein
MALRVTARVAMTRQVTALIERLNRHPAVLINGSAIGWYGLRGDEALTPFEFGAGGPMGSGRQWMSWIERDDLNRPVAHVIASPDLAGPLNATAPEPVTNAGLSTALGKALHRPAFLRVPAILLRPLGGFADELLLGGQRVLPAKAIVSGFRFRHGDLASALGYILGVAPGRSGRPVSAAAGKRYRAGSAPMPRER